MFLYVLLIIVICLAIIRKRGKDEKPLSRINTTIINGVFVLLVFLSHSTQYFDLPNNLWLNHKFCGISDSSRSSVGSYRIASERNIRHQDIRIPVCEES